MPKKYEELRDKFIAEGLTSKAAKRKAAKMYNAQRDSSTPPVTGKHGAQRQGLSSLVRAARRKQHR